MRLNEAQTGKVWSQWQRLAQSAPARFRRYGEIDRAFLADEVVGDAALEALAKVAWNTALAEALTPVLQAVEISLRNWMNAAIIAYLEQLKQAAAADWLRKPPFFMIEGDIELARVAADKLQHQVDLGNRKSFGHDDMVAATSFALWSNMIRNNNVWSALSTYKQGALTKAFGDRQSLHKMVDAIRTLRNRAYHLEPVFLHTGIASVHLSAVDLLQILDPRFFQVISCVDRFGSVYSDGQGWKQYRDKLFDQYGLADLA